MTRRSRSLASVLAILALLFAQLMATVHACDVDMAAKMSVAASSGMQASGDCCDNAQPQADPACDNHCQQGKQAPERAQATTVMPLAALGFAMPGALATTLAGPRDHPRLAPHLARDTEPSISVRNCCFRI